MPHKLPQLANAVRELALGAIPTRAGRHPLATQFRLVQLRAFISRRHLRMRMRMRVSATMRMHRSLVLTLVLVLVFHLLQLQRHMLCNRAIKLGLRRKGGLPGISVHEALLLLQVPRRRQKSVVLGHVIPRRLGKRCGVLGEVRGGLRVPHRSTLLSLAELQLQRITRSNPVE